MENAADFRLRKSRKAFSAELKSARGGPSAHADEQPNVAEKFPQAKARAGIA